MDSTKSNHGRSSLLSRKSFTFLCLLISFVFCSGRAVAVEMVPFVISAKPNPDSPIAASPAEPITTDSPRLIARSGHFYRGDDRIRLWGVNLSFGANFPTHEAAPYIAARMAAVGVNSVRCHHMDTSRWPSGIWNAKDGKDISPEALDRLDFFIDQLARRGIYADINLHVGREHSKYLGLPDTGRGYDKITNIFAPALIDAQKKYARDLLGHVNKYRKVRYAADPAVAIVEITNENSFFMWDGDQALRTLPDHYAKILQAKFNSWLKSEYGSDNSLRAAWSEGIQLLGENILKNGALDSTQAGSSVPLSWDMEQHEDCKASCSRQQLESADALKINIANADDTEWHLQFNQRGLALKKDQYYTVIFEAAADQPRRITCAVGQADSPWSNLGLSQRIDLTNKRTAYRLGFTATADEDNARLSFSIGGSQIPIYLAGIKLRPGGRLGLREDESLGKNNIALFAETESPRRTIDRMTFLAQTEKAYFDDMRNFIQKDLGSKALVTGTIVFGPLGLYTQSDMDFIDSHAYWQHPHFPNRPWDPGDWLIDQKPMTDYPNEATLFRLAAERLAGKPYTCTEYNHPAPLDSQAECVPMIASFAAAQDWDGIWFYTYSHSSDDWDRQNMNSFFDIDTNPAKWGFMRAGAAIFREAVVSPVEGCLVAPLAASSDIVHDLARLYLKHNLNMFTAASATSGTTREAMLTNRFYVSFRPSSPVGTAVQSPTKLAWSVENGKGFYYVGSGAGVLAGDTTKFELARIDSPAYAVITASPLDGMPWWKSNKILITACGRCENTGMKFSQDRRTVGRDWGAAPVLIEPVEGTVMVPTGQWKCQAVGPDGMPQSEVPVSNRDGQSVVGLSPKYKTMWYLLTRL